jgi:6-phosphofructokinase
MAKGKKFTEVVEAPVAAEAAPKVPATRGPRGTVETAVITVLVGDNPKRAGSKAHTVFGHYQSGQTIAEFADALAAADLGKEATPNLVYDAKHGFIAIDGYDPGEIVVKAAKEPKAPKEAKAPKAKKEKKAAEDTSAVEAAVVEETM